MDYDRAGPLTSFDDDVLPQLAGLPSDPIELCRVAQSLVVLPNLADGFGIAEARHEERSIRPASDIVRRLAELDARPLVEDRPFDRRVVGTCRHFAALACALLRHQGIPARARAGFATYFVPDKYLDHWIVEHRHPDEGRWVRVDPEILGFPYVDAPDDLQPGEFLTGGEAWTLCREGSADPDLFGVDGAPHAWGIAEVRGNAVRDLAALNKLEMLPWDEWGRMNESYAGLTGPDYDALMDRIAATCASDDPLAIADLYASDDLSVPLSMIV